MQIANDTQRKFQEQMRAKSLRLTKTRQQIFECLIQSNKPLSISELVDYIDDAHFVSVYRSVDALRKSGIIKLVPQNSKNLYELGDDFKPHHHHVSCENCGLTQKVDDKRIESILKQLTREAGLAPTRHHFELYGLCTSCERSA